MDIFTKRVQLELYMEDPLRCLETDSAGPLVITLTNMYFHYEVIDLAPAVKDALLTKASGGVCYPYKSFVYYTQPVIAGQADYLIPHASPNIDGFINFMVRNDNLLNPLINDKFLTWNYNGAQQWQLRINNEFYPLEPVFTNLDPQGYLQLLRWIEKWSLGGVYKNHPVISFEEFLIDRFIIVVQLEPWPGQGLFSNISTSNSGNNVFLRLYLSAPPANPTSLITYAVVSKTIEFSGTQLRQ
jgi:hypothetical protein